MTRMCARGWSTATVVVTVAGATAMCQAWEFRSRFVQRVGNTDVLISDPYSIPDNQPTRVRLQFGVFDDQNGAAPTGGFVGWNVGTLSITGISNPLRAGARRTPGRLAPFNFANNGNGIPAAPAGDPFGSLTQLDVTLGIQSPLWVCDANGQAPPQPPAIVRGLNTFVSVYEITLTPLDYYLVFNVTATGNLIAATDWRPSGTPIPPNCDDPDNPEGGMVTYVPLPTTPQPFSTSFTFVSNGVPGPGAGGVIGATVLGMAARRRRREA